MEFLINGNYFINFIRTTEGVGVFKMDKMYKVHKRIGLFQGLKSCR